MSVFVVHLKKEEKCFCLLYTTKPHTHTILYNDVDNKIAEPNYQITIPKVLLDENHIDFLFNWGKAREKN